MSDVMKVAEARKSELEKSIVVLEKEISDIRDEMATLDDFLEFGAALMQQDGKPTAPAAKAAAPKEAAAPKKRENSRLPSLDDSVDPFDQPDSASASVSELHPTQRPVSRPA